MTEDDAKKKWCPSARNSFAEEFRDCAVAHAGNRELMRSGCNCLASECMMWTWHEPHWAKEGERHGFCGLAKEPR